MDVDVAANPQSDDVAVTVDADADVAGGDEGGGSEGYRPLPTAEAIPGGAAVGGGGDTAAAADGVESPTDEATPLQMVAGVAGIVLESHYRVAYFWLEMSSDMLLFNGFVFAIMNHLGGCLLGWIGDTYGRKRALQTSIFLLALPAIAIGCLPPNAIEEKLWTGWALLNARCLQELGSGGQLTSSLVFTLEKHHKSQWGLYGSHVMAAKYVGVLLGCLTSSGLGASLTKQQLQDWGWRIPFLLSGILMILSGIYLKYHCEEDHPQGPRGGPVPNPILVAFSRRNQCALMSATLVTMIWYGGQNLTFVWLGYNFGRNYFSLGSLFLCIMLPLAGKLSNMLGRNRTMTIGGVGLAVLPPLLIIIVGLGSPYLAFLAQSTLGIVSLCLWGAPMTAWLLESFEPAARLTSVTVGHNLARTVAWWFVMWYWPNHDGDKHTALSVALSMLSVAGLMCALPRADRVGLETAAGDEAERDETERITDSMDGGVEMEHQEDMT